MPRTLSVLLIAASCEAPVRGAVIARAGQPAMAIAGAAEPTPSERFAVEELALHLEQITGAAFSIVEEDELPEDSPAIFVGQTRFATIAGIDPAAMGEEESLVRTVGGNLVLTGGRPRGTLYAVYEFIERDLGVAWLSEDVTLIPKRPDLTVDSLNRRRSPAFAGMRWIYTSQREHNHTEEFIRKMDLWHARNRIGAGAWLWGDDQRMGVRRRGWPNWSHSFYAYIPPDEYFDEHPEWFSMGVGGHRMRGGGQLCLTNAAMREQVVRRMREAIVEDRARAQEENRPHPILYDLGMNDYHNMCQCPECREVVEREDAESGLVLEVVNAVAEEIGRDYPDITIWTFAYSLTIHPPKTVRPRDNVMIHLAYLAPGNWRDPSKPLTHDANAEHREATEGWARLGARIRIWDYWRLFVGDTFETPYTRVTVIQDDLRFLHGLGVRDGYFVEFYGEERLSFVALTRWLGTKLLDDPAQDAEALIDRFMQAWYGPAAEPMHEWLEYLTGRLAENTVSLTAAPVYRRPYMDLAFFRDAYEILGRAEQRCDQGSPELARTWAERMPVDTALLGLWDTLAAKLGEGEDMPWDREQILERYIAHKKEVVRSLRVPETVGNALATIDEEDARLRLALTQPPLPAAFEALPREDVVDVLREASWDYPRFERRVVDDPDAPGGVAVRLATPDDEPGAEIPMGLYCEPQRWGPTITLVSAKAPGDEATWFEEGLGEERQGPRADIPMDEAYCWYRLGPFRITPGTILHAHPSWYMSLGIDRPLRLGYPEEDWYVFVSVKLEGPAYVPGSSKKNALYVGRIVLVRAANPRAGEFMPAEPQN